LKSQIRSFSASVYILVILTPYSGDVDPSVDFGLFKRTFV